MTGLSVSVLIDAHLPDSSNGGATSPTGRSRYRTYVLFDEAIERGNYDLEECKDDPTICCLKVVRRRFGSGEYLHVESMFERHEDKAGPCFGGNYITTSDSRFRNVSEYPLPVHDRWDTWEDYDRLTR